MLLARLTSAGLGIDSPEPHFPHQALDPLPVHAVPSMPTFNAQASTSVEWPLQIGACKIKCVTGYHHCFINEGGVDDQEKYENRCAA